MRKTHAFTILRQALNPQCAGNRSPDAFNRDYFQSCGDGDVSLAMVRNDAACKSKSADFRKALVNRSYRAYFAREAHFLWLAMPASMGLSK